MILSIIERIELAGLLPNEGSFSDLIAWKKLKYELAFSEEEKNEMNITTQGGQVTWAKEITKDILISLPTTHFVSKLLKRLDKEGKLKESQVTLYEKFVIGGTDAEQKT